MNKANFLAKENFPQSTYTFDFMQKMIHLAGSMALLGGDNYILAGCVEDKSGNVSEGLITIDGELLPFAGGAKKAKVKIQETKESDHFNGVDYPEAYIHRKVVFADDGDILWDDLKQVLTNKALEQKISSIKGDAPGTVKMWAGTVSSIPDDYLLCDGKPLKNDEYPELYKNLNAIHGVEGTDSFLLPDLSGRFIVGYNNQHEDYDVIGKKDGKEKVVLEVSQMPKHRHSYSDDTNAQGKFPAIEPGFPQTVGGINETKSSGSSSGTGTVYGTSFEGGVNGATQAHENRPPYFVLAYIIKVK